MVKLCLVTVHYKDAPNRYTETLHWSWGWVLQCVMKVAANLPIIFCLLTRCVTGSKFLILQFWTRSDSSQPGGVSRRRGCPAGAAFFSGCYSWGSTQSCHLLSQTGEVHDPVSCFAVSFWNWNLEYLLSEVHRFSKIRCHCKILGTIRFSWSKIPYWGLRDVRQHHAIFSPTSTWHPGFVHPCLTLQPPFSLLHRLCNHLVQLCICT
jgi:hypothetical protein